MNIKNIIRRNIRRILNENNASHPEMWNKIYQEAQKLGNEIYTKLAYKLSVGDFENSYATDTFHTIIEYERPIPNSDKIVTIDAKCYLIKDTEEDNRDLASYLIAHDGYDRSMTRNSYIHKYDRSGEFHFDLVFYYRSDIGISLTNPQNNAKALYPISPSDISVIAREMTKYMEDIEDGDRFRKEGSELRDYQFLADNMGPGGHLGELLTVTHLQGIRSSVNATYSYIRSKIEQDIRNNGRQTVDINEYIKNNVTYNGVKEIERLLRMMERDPSLMNMCQRYYTVGYGLEKINGMNFNTFLQFARRRCDDIKKMFDCMSQQLRNEFPNAKSMSRMDIRKSNMGQYGY